MSLVLGESATMASNDNKEVSIKITKTLNDERALDLLPQSRYLLESGDVSEEERLDLLFSHGVMIQQDGQKRLYLLKLSEKIVRINTKLEVSAP